MVAPANTTTSQGVDSKEPTTCPICQDGRTPARAIANCPSSHRFCTDCIAKAAAIDSSCPLCRAQITSFIAANGRTIAVRPRRQPTQPIHENAEPLPGSDDEADGDMEVVEDQSASLPSAPAQHVDAYNTIQSNLSLARECIATALSLLQLNDITTFGEVRCAIPSIRDFDAYRATTTTDMRTFAKKLTSVTTQLTKTIDKHTKIAKRSYIQRVDAAEARERQRLQEDLNRRQAQINREREQLRQQQQQVEAELAQLRRRAPPRR